jgi:hypothetical protein
MLLLAVAGLGTAGFLWMQGNANKNRKTDQTLAHADSSKPDPSTKQPETNAAPTRVSKGSTDSKADAKPVEAQPETKQAIQVVKAPVPAAERATETDGQRMAFFETKIRPVLVQHCYGCHSAEAEKAKKLRGGLFVDSKEGLRKGGDSGPAIVPGDIRQSLLLQAIQHRKGFEMPPGKQLPNEVVLDFIKWVEIGAPDPRSGPATVVAKKPANPEAGKAHWAFAPLQQSNPPAMEKQSWPRTPIDHFVFAKLEENKLSPNPQVGKEKLVRRAYFDLWGLPPTPADIDAFVKDNAPDAYPKLIDRLLASERYGERWARHWLDVVRFAESGGYEFDKDRPNAYHYRDFVIRALNQDMPYDQFTRLQIAGDLLQPGDHLATSATGFLVAGPFPGQTTAKTTEVIRYDHLDDMISTIGQGMLGLSIGCARCHDHKLDTAIVQEDYYRLAACLALTDSAETKLGPEQKPVFAAAEKPDGVTYLHEGGQGISKIDSVHFLMRGEVERKKDKAKPGFLRPLMNTPQQEKNWLIAPPLLKLPPTHPRIALASWLTDVRQGAGPLLGRVIVNRLWQHHLGRGLVATPNDFGVQGEPPTHPELLDFLAGELIHEGWKLKHIHKLIMTSAVYMQAGDALAANLQADPQNRLWWRHPTRRLEGEAIRDSLLMAGGTLDLAMYGAGSLNEYLPRRSVYLTVKRSQPISFLQLFDTPEAIQSTGDRQTTTVAPQALAMMNSPFVRQAAEKLAQRLQPKTPDQLQRSIDDIYRFALGRRPTANERKVAQAFITKQTATGRQAEALADFCQVILCSHEFVYVD